jgi:zeaxanthin glucosyltransferase
MGQHEPFWNNMSRFGILSFPGTGHLHPLTALGRELERRGHHVTVFQVADTEPLVRAAGLAFHQIGELEFPLGSLRALDQRLGRLEGMEALAFIFERFGHNSQMILRDAPEAIRSESIDALIVDQAEWAGGSVAERLGLPFITAILTLPLHLDLGVPFCAFHEGIARGFQPRVQTAAGNVRVWAMAQKHRAQIHRQRARWGLPPRTGWGAFDSDLAQVAQLPAAFDFPRRRLPACFHYTGPFCDEVGRAEVDFPWSRLDGSRPLAFVSMGTLQNGNERIFQAVAEACASFPVQTVISLGGGLPPERLGSLPGHPLVVRYAPQLALLQRAALTIFHGGLNTALESLAHGVPMVAVPVTLDQPGVGARLAWTGTGTAIPASKLTVERLRRAIGTVLTDPRYRLNAQGLQRHLAANGGVQRAADVMERALLGRFAGLFHPSAAERPRLAEPILAPFG